MRAAILILTIFGYVVLLTLQAGKVGGLYCQSCCSAWELTGSGPPIPSCYVINCDNPESRRLRLASTKEMYTGLYEMIPIAVGIFGAVYAFNCLGRGQPGLPGGIFLLASVSIFPVIWLLLGSLKENLSDYLNLPLIFPLMAAMLAIFLKPTEPIPSTETDPSDHPEDGK